MKTLAVLFAVLISLNLFAQSHDSKEGGERPFVKKGEAGPFIHVPTRVGVERLEDVSWLYKLEPIKFKVFKIGKDGKETKELKAGELYGLDAEGVASINKNIVLFVDGKPLAIYDNMVTYSLLRAVQKQREWICKQPNKPLGLCEK